MRWLAPAAVYLALVAPASAWAGWSAPQLLTDHGGLGALGAGRDGGARAAVSYENGGVALRDADASGVFGPPRAVIPGPSRNAETRLAADGSGVTLAYEPDRKRFTAVPFDSSGATSDPVPVEGDDLALGLSPAGAAVVAWTRPVDDRVEVVAAVREAGATSFAPPRRAGYAFGGDTLVEAGIGDSGETTVTWQPNGFPSPLAAAVRLPGAEFSAPRIVSREVSIVSFAVGAGGQAILGDVAGHRARQSIKPPGQPFVSPLRSFPTSGPAESVGVQAAGSDTVGFVITARTGRARHAPFLTRVYGGTTRREVRPWVALPGQLSPAMTLAPDGRVLLGWDHAGAKRRGDPTSRSRFAVAYRPAHGRLRGPTLLGPTVLSAEPSGLLLGAGGSAYVAFRDFEASESAPRRNGFDRTMIARWVP